MDDAVKLQIMAVRRHVVEHQHCRLTPREKVLQRKNLPPIAQRVLRQQAHLGKRVEHNARRIDALDLIAQQPHCLAELDFRGAEHGLPIAVAVLAIGRHEFAHLDAFQRPAVGGGDGTQFVAGLGHADVQHSFTLVTASQNEVHS